MPYFGVVIHGRHAQQVVDAIDDCLQENHRSKGSRLCIEIKAVSNFNLPEVGVLC